MLSQLPLREAVAQIINLLNEEKLVEAHRACLEILRYDPENIKVIKLKNKIEKMVKKINIKTVKNELKELKPLWREKKYEELLAGLIKLEPFISNYPRLKKIILKVKKHYEAQLKNQKENYYQNEIKKINELIKTKKFQQGIDAAEKLRVLKMHENELKKLLSNAHRAWIDDEIDQNKILLQSEKYEDILMFYQKLLKIDATDSRLKQLIDKTKKKYQLYKIDDKREFIYTGIEKIRILYQHKKYEKALAASEEILDIDPKNKPARFFSENSRKKINHLIEKECSGQMRNSWNELAKLYKKDKKAFVKI